MEFRILGPLEVVDERGVVVELGGARERALLALLVLHANEVLSSDRIVEELWPSGPPETATKIVQLYVSHLRRALGDSRDLIETRTRGYRLVVDRSSTDVGRCEQLVAEASGADPSVRAERLREALRLWRGSPLADLEYESFAQQEIGRLSEWRVGILEERVAADLDRGRGPELVAELDILVREHPLRERLRAEHMLALYRAGRQADALGSYRALRDQLDDELGLEPGIAVRELEQAILRHDPSLAGTAVADGPASDVTGVLLVASRAGELGDVLSLGKALVNVDRRRELVLARLVVAAQLTAATRSLVVLRDELVERDITARVAAFTSVDPGPDLVRLASGDGVELAIVGVDADVIDGDVATLLKDAPCDVALLVEGSKPRTGPVMVPFGAARHDWAALEIGAWLARGSGSPLQLVGSASPGPEDRDASRLLADVSLVVQRATGVIAEPVLSRSGSGVVETTRSAGAVVVGLSERWPEDGLGPVRAALAASPPARVLFVRRGVRPSGIAPPGELTSFAWSTERSRLDRR